MKCTLEPSNFHFGRRHSDEQYGKLEIDDDWTEKALLFQ